MKITSGTEAQALFEASTEEHKVDLTLPKPKADGTKAPDATERATWRK